MYNSIEDEETDEGRLHTCSGHSSSLIDPSAGASPATPACDPAPASNSENCGIIFESNISASLSGMKQIGPPKEMRNSGSCGGPVRYVSPNSSVENDEAEVPPRSRCAFVS